MLCVYHTLFLKQRKLKKLSLRKSQGREHTFTLLHCIYTICLQHEKNPHISAVQIRAAPGATELGWCEGL